MTIESFLSRKIQHFSIEDLGLVKAAYLVLGFYIFSIYPPLHALDWWFYLILALLSVLPLGVHLFSQKGNILEKTYQYIKTNSPSNQMLLALTMFFYALTIGKLFPVLLSAPQWVYLVLIFLFAIKPVKIVWFKK